MKLEIALFMEHNASSFPLEQIFEFMKNKNISSWSWSNQIKCDYCESTELEYFREEVVYYNETKGFYLSDYSDYDEDDDCVDFAIYICPKCGKWVTYIE